MICLLALAALAAEFTVELGASARVARIDDQAHSARVWLSGLGASWTGGHGLGFSADVTLPATITYPEGRPEWDQTYTGADVRSHLLAHWRPQLIEAGTFGFECDLAIGAMVGLRSYYEPFPDSEDVCPFEPWFCGPYTLQRKEGTLVVGPAGSLAGVASFARVRLHLGLQAVVYSKRPPLRWVQPDLRGGDRMRLEAAPWAGLSVEMGPR